MMCRTTAPKVGLSDQRPASRPGPRRWVPAIVGVAAILALVPITRGRTMVWRDDESLFSDAVNADSSNWMAACNLGGALIDRGRLDRAEPILVEAVRLNPRYAPSHQNLGVLLAKRFRYSEAIERYREAVRLSPNYADAWNNLGLALGALRRDAEAFDAFARASSIQPGNADFRANLGTALFKTGKMDEARVQLSEALRLDPRNATARSSLTFLDRFGGVKSAPAPALP